MCMMQLMTTFNFSIINMDWIEQNQNQNQYFLIKVQIAFVVVVDYLDLYNYVYIIIYRAIYLGLDTEYIQEQAFNLTV